MIEKINKKRRRKINKDIKAINCWLKIIPKIINLINNKIEQKENNNNITLFQEMDPPIFEKKLTGSNSLNKIFYF